ncbi:MAG: T9SS type A sorting domain-containing protein [Bacteroidota bacterium]
MKRMLSASSPILPQITCYIDSEIGNAVITVYDTKGAEVLSLQMDSYPFRADVSSLPKGVYFLKIVSGSTAWSEKFVKL